MALILGLSLGCGPLLSLGGCLLASLGCCL